MDKGGPIGRRCPVGDPDDGWGRLGLGSGACRMGSGGQIQS